MNSNDENLQMEQKWYQFWLDNKLFEANPSSDKPSYSLLMPPPNLTGEPHLGHAMQHAILDAVARFKRMQGFDVLLLPGVDHAGIQFEGTLNKILSKEGLHKRNLDREEWLKRAWEFKTSVYNSYHDTWKIFGISADWSREVFTLEPKVQKAVLEEFKTFWNQDLLYKGAYIVQWCPKCGTAIEDLEMEYQDKAEKLYFVKYKLSDSESVITVATARPETIFADVAIAIYPNHPNFSHYKGKSAINPLNGKLLPIIEDERVKKDFGTGALKITPGHDPLDYQIGKDNGLEILHAVGKDGKMTDLSGEFKDVKVEEAREQAEQKLLDLEAIEKIEDYTHSVPVCERCKTVVEPLISEEWFVRMKPIAEKALKNIDKIKFLPDNYQRILTDWLSEIHDWSISRSLWWGHRIPVWYCQSCNPAHRVSKDQGIYISFETPNISCPVCGSDNWIQDDQVLDTWFSSGLWPIATLGWPSSAEISEAGKATEGMRNLPEEMKRYFPWNFALTAPEIRYLWIARMIMLSLWFVDSIPFENMFFHGMLRDLQGKKFSKSLGNGIDPNVLREKWGTDSTRMALYSYSAPGRDAKTSPQIMDERCKNFRNFSTKLKNIYRFIYELKPESGETPTLSFDQEDDKRIKAELVKTVKSATDNIENFQLHLATEEIYNFVWHQFADIYIEKTKNRRAESQPVLEYVFETTLKMLHPFMPFLTEELYQKLPDKNKSVILSEWPKS